MDGTRLNGILLVDKAQGWTSHDVVAKLRAITREKRIGHAGTLDPMATGLLVVFLGRATRAAAFAEAGSKSYAAGLRLGLTTDTQDITGTTVKASEAHVTREDLEAALPAFRGEISQLPPMYSAIKVHGKKLYETARKGGEIERAPRPVTVSRLEITGEQNGDFLLAVDCSKGTYIRTLCHDIGEALGCGGCMSSLRRTRAGDFLLDDAHTTDEIEREGAERFLLPVDRVFSQYPKLMLTIEQAERCRVGAKFSASAEDGLYRCYSPSGEFLMLGRIESDMMSTIKNFFEV